MSELKVNSSPHIHSGNRVYTVMLQVVLAMLPGVLLYAGLFGWGVISNLLLSTLFCYVFEAIGLYWRGRSLLRYLGDGSALVTALLMALAIPPWAPWWVLCVGALFAILISKQLFGGLGYNPFNPAMVGYAVLLVSFPVQMTAWPAPLGLQTGALQGLVDTLHLVFADGLMGLEPDSYTMATPLDALKEALRGNATVDGFALQSPVLGSWSGDGWWLVNLAFLAGGLWMIYRKLITWHVPAAMLGALGLLSLGFHWWQPDHYAGPIYHWFSGAAMLGAFFIATDPVSGCTSNPARIVFGAGAGVLLYVIRTWGGYPDAVAFSVLLMNSAAPMLDQLLQPRVFGHKRR